MTPFRFPAAVPLAFLAAGATVSPAEEVGSWDLERLFSVPEMRWVSRDGPIHSLIYEGEPVRGRETEVFAFHASPATLDPAAVGPFPGVVLVHGGGGTAFADWVWLWAKRGYAAIAMDLSGRRPPAPRFDPATGEPVGNQAALRETRTKLANGGLDQTHAEKFGSVVTEDGSDDWPYHAVAGVIRAHSLLRSFEGVDAERTAVTGISWGGYTTCLVASLDSRFRAAVPVYGCGFLFEGESVQKPAIDGLGAHRQRWIERYDPSRWLPRCRVPILFVNGTNDKHYPLDSYQKSYDLVPGEKAMRIEEGMRHSHPAGWAPEEIGLFIDSKCRDGEALAVPGEPVLVDGRVELFCESGRPLVSAALHFTADDGPRADRGWTSVPAEWDGTRFTAAAPPAGANTWFLTVTDDRGAMVSTAVRFAERR